MPRSNQPRRRRGRPGSTAPTAAPLDLERARAGISRRESAPDGTWLVRTMKASRAEKEYLCPGCSLPIPPGMQHLVVWKEDHLFGAATGLSERRHWHQKCWTGRNFRYR